MDPSQMMPRSFPMWAPPPPAASSDPSAMPPPQPFLPPPNAKLAPNRGWKRKNPNSGGVGYQPPALGDLQVQNRAKARRWFKNPNNPNQNQPNNHNRKYFFHKPKAAAPRNTTSFIIRAKRAGGIASLVSPCPVTPAVLPTPRLSPSREGLSDMAQAQWGVDGYGSMKGLIRLRRSPQNDNPNAAASDDDDEGNSSGSDVEEHVEVERRLDHDLSRFEMVYPGRGEEAGGYVFEEDDEYDQDVHVARLEEENLTLKERLFLMEQEVGDMRRRLEVLEARFAGTDGVGSGGGGAANAVDEALANGMERGDANAGAGNAVEEALENGMEIDDNAAHTTAVEVAPENGMEKCEAGPEKSGEDNFKRVNLGSEKSGEHNAEISDVGSDKSGENDAERGNAGSGGDNNGEEQA